MAKVILIKEDCISCGACASVDDKLFEMKRKEDNTYEVIIIGGEDKGDRYEKEIENVESAKEAMESCPTEAIKIEE